MLSRIGKRLAIQASRHSHAHHCKHMPWQLKSRLGRIVRDIEPKSAEWKQPVQSLSHELTLAKRPHKGHKVYSLPGNPYDEDSLI